MEKEKLQSRGSNPTHIKFQCNAKVVVFSEYRNESFSTLPASGSFHNKSKTKESETCYFKNRASLRCQCKSNKIKSILRLKHFPILETKNENENEKEKKTKQITKQQPKTKHSDHIKIISNI